MISRHNSPLSRPTKAPGALRLVVRVLQDVVRCHQFDSYADLTEASKARLARLKIPYDAGMVHDAIDQLERGGRRPLVQPGRSAPRVDIASPDVLVNHAAAQRILTTVGVDVSRGRLARAGHSGDVDLEAPVGFPRLVRVQ